MFSRPPVSPTTAPHTVSDQSALLLKMPYPKTNCLTSSCPYRVEEKGFCPRLASYILVWTSQNAACLCRRNTVLPAFSSQAKVLPSHLPAGLLSGWICPFSLPESTILHELVPALNRTLCLFPSSPWGRSADQHSIPAALGGTSDNDEQCQPWHHSALFLVHLTTTTAATHPLATVF